MSHSSFALEQSAYAAIKAAACGPAIRDRRTFWLDGADQETYFTNACTLSRSALKDGPYPKASSGACDPAHCGSAAVAANAVPDCGRVRCQRWKSAYTRLRDVPYRSSSLIFSAATSAALFPDSSIEPNVGPILASPWVSVTDIPAAIRPG